MLMPPIERMGCKGWGESRSSEATQVSWIAWPLEEIKKSTEPTELGSEDGLVAPEIVLLLMMNPAGEDR
jgi:hypothetical protein